MAQRSAAGKATVPARTPYSTGAARLQLLDDRERAAVAIRDFRSANRVLAERLRLKAEVLAASEAEPVAGGAR